MVQVTFGVDLRGDDPAAVVNEAAQKVNRAMAAAREMGVAVENPDALVKAARQKALENARAQAEQMAQVLGISLGKPVLVSEGGWYPVASAMRVEGVGGGVEAPSISPGAFSVTVSVQVVYEIR